MEYMTQKRLTTRPMCVENTANTRALRLLKTQIYKTSLRKDCTMTNLQKTYREELKSTKKVFQQFLKIAFTDTSKVSMEEIFKTTGMREKSDAGAGGPRYRKN